MPRDAARFRTAKFGAAVLVLASGALTVGCVGDDQEARSSPTPTDLEEALNIQQELNKDYAAQVEHCMRSLGFDYEQPIDSNPAQSPEAVNLTEMERAQSFGYALSEGRLLQIRQSKSEAAAIVASVSEFDNYGEAEAALNGDENSEGCKAIASKYIETEKSDEISLLRNLSPAADEAGNAQIAEAMAEPGFVELEKAWSECMGGFGFSDMPGRQYAVIAVINMLEAIKVATSESFEVAAVPLLPSEALSATSEEEFVRAVQPVEIDVAVADLTCQTNVRYQETLAKLIEQRSN